MNQKNREDLHYGEVVTFDFASELGDSELPQLIEPRDGRSSRIVFGPIVIVVVGFGNVVVLAEAAFEVAVLLLAVLRCEKVVERGAPLLKFQGDGVPALGAVPVDGAR